MAERKRFIDQQYPPSVISIGNIGSGKTTSLPLLAEAVGGRIIPSDTIFFTIPSKNAYLDALRQFDLPEREREQPQKQLQEIVFDHERAMLRERVGFISERLHETTAEGLMPVIDSGPPMNWVYTWGHRNKGRISPQHWGDFTAEYDKLTSELFGNGTVIYMKDSPENCRERIVSRAQEEPEQRKFEVEAYTLGYLTDLHDGLEAFVERYQDAYQLITVDVPTIGNIAKEGDKKAAFVQSARAIDYV